MRPKTLLPLPQGRSDDEQFLEDLLKFFTSCEMLQILCGGVHILDFLVREPDLYASVFPIEWRRWLSAVDIMDLIDLLNCEDVAALLQASVEGKNTWRSYAIPPSSMLRYIVDVRAFLFDRSFRDADDRPGASVVKPIPRNLKVGMTGKKVHEVENFSAFVNELVLDIASTREYEISDVVDFGAGQGYLGRVLASPLYGRDIVAIESKAHNIDASKKNDSAAKVAKREIVYRNKKLFRAGYDNETIEKMENFWRQEAKATRESELNADKSPSNVSQCGTIRHIEHRITGGDLTPVVDKLKVAKRFNAQSEPTDEMEQEPDPRLLVISLHSCGNLLHHGLRSLMLNESVRAVAMVGCCYNLCTEKLGGPTYKLPNLRSSNKRLEETSNMCDADGYPMSRKFAEYDHAAGPGVRLNITARTLAVQAPRNWTQENTDDFFTRHFYRALLQRVFLDYGIVQPPRGAESHSDEIVGDQQSNQVITIGALAKTCFTSFPAYVRGALKRLKGDELRGSSFQKLDLDLTDADIKHYELRYASRRHELCVLWSFMAFSAAVVESLMVADRWQWLREQDGVAISWVQTVFDYSRSPRNLVVVGLKA